MLGSTLDAMARGGIHDQIGGGFARYSVDAAWLVPHFEKMLYDNAQLARLYLWAWRELGEDAYRAVAVSTLEYMLRDLGQPDGGFWSGEDADSEGEEGRFYVFTADEMREAVGEEDSEPASLFFGVTAAGNFEGSNVLHQARTIEEVTAATGATAEEVEAALSRARDRLVEARSARVRPGLDDKVVASWNGLALRALAEAGAVLEEPRHLEAARRTARFLLDRLHRDDGRLLRSWSPHGSDGGVVPGFLEDHAALAVGLLALYQATGRPSGTPPPGASSTPCSTLFDDGTLHRVGRDAGAVGGRPPGSVRQPAPLGELAGGGGASPALALHRGAALPGSRRDCPPGRVGDRRLLPDGGGASPGRGSLGGDRGEGGGGGRSRGGGARQGGVGAVPTRGPAGLVDRRGAGRTRSRCSPTGGALERPWPMSARDSSVRRRSPTRRRCERTGLIVGG